MTRHVVFGTGQVGRLVVERLVARGVDVTAVNRHGGIGPAGAPVVAGDAADESFATRVTAGAGVVYSCLNASSYRSWNDELPPLQRGVLAGAERAGARLVVLDNLYAYGRTNGRPLVETLPARPNSAKAATRAAMTAELLAAHQAGRVQVAIGRASDYFGPGTRQSALGDTVFAAALSGRAAEVMGRPDLPHSYSYTPDVAAALITLATQPAATGSVWHLPIAETRTTRQIIDHVYRQAGHRPRCVAAGATALRLLGIVKPQMREHLHTVYQFAEPWVVDDSRFRSAFGDLATPLDDALDATLDWYVSTAEHGAGALRPTSDVASRSIDPDIPTSPAEETTMHLNSALRLAAGAMAGAAILAIAGFTALGSIFDYPDILTSPTVEILAAYRRHQSAITGWFLVLTVSAGLLAPIGVLLGRIAGGPVGRWIAGVGIAAASVQVIGLARWVLLVPVVSHDALRPGHTADAHRTFDLLHTWLGEILGETIGYVLTATFTLLVVRAITRTVAPRWMSWVGNAAAVLIATGVVIPLGIEAASLTNFAGYVAWCLWLIAMAVALWRSSSTAMSTVGPAPVASTSSV